MAEPTPPPDRRHRVFFALWPDKALREALAGQRARCTAPGRDVPLSHLHLTLAFAGTVATAQLDALRRAADAVRAPPFVLQLDRLDGFEAARVQWLGPSAPPESLQTLARELQQGCRQAGIALREEDFQPHVTLRRNCRKPIRKAVAAIAWPVSDFALIESGQAGRPGAYRVLGRWPLRSA
jgi:2'-5' RNA ligase